MTADSLAAARRDHREQMHVATAARQAAEAGLEGQRNARKAAERALRRAVRRAWKPSSTSREAGRTTRQRTGKEAFETNIPPRARSPQVPKQRATQPVQSWIKSKDRDCLKSFGDINEWHTVMLHDWGRRRIVMNTLRATALLVSLPRAIRTALSGPRIAVEKSDWISFRDRFVTGEGRVVDNGNGGVSHTEAQGCGMLFAVTFDDRDTFELISGWTERVLRRQTDSLHAWRYLPDAQEHVPDTNNATDGDLIIAFSHARAAQRWRLSKSKRTAAAIARDVINLLVREVAGRTILLPAAKGFVKDDVVIVNPSYYVFPAFTALAPLLPSFRWDKLVADGVALIAEGRFGKWHLPPDWLAINTRDGLLAPASGWPPRFSYDAVRVPLYLIWNRMLGRDTLAPFATFWQSAPPAELPAWIDVRTDAPAPYAASPGIRAIAGLVEVATHSSRDSSLISPVSSTSDYYSAVLILLVRIAQAVFTSPATVHEQP